MLDKTQSEIVSQVVDVFKREFGSPEGLTLVRTPGRVNLIGEHTDYNEGYVFPTTINRAVYIAVRPRSDRSCAYYSLNFQDRATWELDDIRRSEGPHWSNYIKGVMKVLVEAGCGIGGSEGVVCGDVPIASGLSSSAALEVATTFALDKAFGLGLDPVRAAVLGREAENTFVGVACGIMDQFVCRLGRKGHALFLDCRSLGYENVPLRLAKHGLLIVDTKVKRELARSAYNQRRAECEEAVRLFQAKAPGVKALRDVDLAMFNRYKDDLPDAVRRRAGHVVSEDARVLDAVRAMKEDDPENVGRLFFESHRSLREDYEVSCEELDFIVETARASGASGARLTGAGFGGCAVVLARKDVLAGLSQDIEVHYVRKFGKAPGIIALNVNYETDVIAV
ncbi:MAG: galactokinase [Candidatus Aminicenantes bacterium]|nr:galactokinase [Candidatus Aminicenantes bacterium]